VKTAIKAFLAGWVLAASPLWVHAAQPSPGAVAYAVPLVDHHLHIFSPEASRVLGVICKALGPKGCPPEVSHAPSTGADLTRALDEAGIKRGVLLSAAYLFSSPELTEPGKAMERQTRDENLFVVAQARASRGRLVPFISVNPLASNALDEIQFWGRHGGAAGLKLHLASARFNFRNPEHVQKLAAVFAASGSAHLAILIHMQTRLKDYGAEDARIFLEDVYPRAAGVPVQIAHAAGGGGVDPGQLAALRTFATAMQRGLAGKSNLQFDLAMVPDLFANAGKIVAPPADVAALESLMQEIGLDRFVPASDYTDGLNLAAYYANQRSALGLSAAEWHQLATNVAPYVEQVRRTSGRAYQP
jgi:predicted TIM-barrel fold metal-dependent hydrolase